jgi:hypothetical protein
VPFLIIAFFFGLAGGVIGKLKGSSFFLWFLISAIPPFIGLVAAVLYRNEYDEPHRRCPTCRKVVPLYDALCTRCGTELEYPGTPGCATGTPPSLRPCQERRSRRHERPNDA